MSIFWVPIVNPAGVDPRRVEPPSVQPQSAQPQPQPQPTPESTSTKDGSTGGQAADAPVRASSAAPADGSGSVEELLRQLFGYLQAHTATHPVLEPALPAVGVAVRAYGLSIPALALNQAVGVYHMLEEARAKDPTLPAP